MKINADRIAQMINGRVQGDGSIEVSSFGKIEEAKQVFWEHLLDRLKSMLFNYDKTQCKD